MHRYSSITYTHLHTRIYIHTDIMYICTHTHTYIWRQRYIHTCIHGCIWRAWSADFIEECSCLVELRAQWGWRRKFKGSWLEVPVKPDIPHRTLPQPNTLNNSTPFTSPFLPYFPLSCLSSSCQSFSNLAIPYLSWPCFTITCLYLTLLHLTFLPCLQPWHARCTETSSNKGFSYFLF